MAKTLDFNTVNRPTLHLIMQDDERTNIIVTTPNEGLIEELNEIAPTLDTVLETMDAEGIRAVYDLAARLISCNRVRLQVTAEDLRDKFKMNLDSLIIFFSAYIDFIDEIIKVKN